MPHSLRRVAHHAISNRFSALLIVANCRPRVPIVAIVGGIGSGKSFLARLLQARHPEAVRVIDGDTIGHEVLNEETVREKIRTEFGLSVFEPDGRINRRAVAQRVFGSGEDETAARRRLEAIVHPRIAEHAEQQIAEARATPAVRLVLLDAALVLEAGWRTWCDAVIFVDSPFSQRSARVQTRGWSEAELRSRESSQLSLDVKRMEADYVIDNSNGPQFALDQLERIVASLVTPGIEQSIDPPVP
jgi:dephospho-CoA kinase